jgi:hypothetical protein
MASDINKNVFANRSYLKPLCRMIKKETVPDDIRDSLVRVKRKRFLTSGANPTTSEFTTTTPAL